MEILTIKLENEIGLHAKPASLLTVIADGFKSDIQVFKNGDEENKYKAKSVLSLIAMEAIKGDVLTFQAKGEDASEAIDAIRAFIDNGCGE